MENKELYAALLKAHDEYPDLVKDSSSHKNDYLGLPGLLALLKKPLKDNGLYLEQPTDFKDGMPLLITRVVHIKTGQYTQSVFPLTLEETNNKATNRVQQEGSTQTYHRRYQIKTLLGLAEVNDDLDGEDKKAATQSNYVPSKESGGNDVTEPQLKLLYKMFAGKDAVKKAYLDAIGIDTFEELTKAEAKSILDKIMPKKE